MGGWSDKTKLILISTLVEVVVEVEVELGKNQIESSWSLTLMTPLYYESIALIHSTIPL